MGERSSANPSWGFELWDFRDFGSTFQAVIRSAATTASRKPKSRQGSFRVAPEGGSAGGQRPQGAPLGIGFVDLVFGEAALEADLITA